MEIIKLTNSQRKQVEKIKNDVKEFIENKQLEGFDFEVKEFEITKNCWDQVEIKISLIDKNKKSKDKNAKIRIGTKGKVEMMGHIKRNGKGLVMNYCSLISAFEIYLIEA